MSEAEAAHEAAPAAEVASTRPSAGSAAPSLQFPAGVLALQRLAGNAAVGWLMRQPPTAAAPAPTPAPAPGGVAAAATVTNQISGEIGEHLLSQALDQRGIIVFTDWSKHVAGNGIDRVAFDPATREIWLLDNKAQWRGIADAPALTGPQYARNLAEVEEFLASNSASKEAAFALEALRAGRLRRVVTNAFAGQTTRFTASLFDRGLCVFDLRMGRLFTSHATWLMEFRALANLRRGMRLTTFRGAALFEGALLVLFVAGGAAYLAHNGAEVKKVASELAAESALGALITRLPGGLFATFVLGLESDNPRLMEARRLEEQVDELTKYVPNYEAMSDADKEAARAVLKQIIKEPLQGAPEPPPPRAPILPFFDQKKWLPPRTDEA
ncbi:MAG: hypothetical protein QOE86_2247 [Solirubrobacteraceae bacterium]|nr:hypothetical protein [Solirubrobacteraceae bacterium]